MKNRIVPATLLLLSCNLILHGQGIRLTSLQESNRKTPQSLSGLNFFKITDTLDLPFFDNFTADKGFPSYNRWADNQVWINNSFPINPPDYNVATFDHLNPLGKPWKGLLNKNTFVYADSLTSQHINLQFYKTGPVTTKNYIPSDSVYLSFFYQTAGLGDVPEAEDSLILYFKTNTGIWKRVWSQTGKVTGEFKQVMVPAYRTEFLHGAFQFRWVNYTKATGNLNHWHLDYVRMDRNRSAKDTSIRDVAIQFASPSLLKDYQTMPYRHFLDNINEQTLPGHSVSIRNLNNTSTVQTRFQLEIRNRYDSLVLLRPFNLSSKNIAPGEDGESFGQVKMDTLSGENPFLKITYKIAPQSDDITPDNYNSAGNNNLYQTRQEFQPWYAWDDGTAEGGFGLNYEFLPDIKGQFAMKFDLLKKDTFRGLGVMFNQSLDDVSNRKFKFRIWRKLSPLGAADNQDELLYETPFELPVYKDTHDGFHYFYFDTTLLLDKGTYYIGWIQFQKYVLNVGYDNNYRFQRQDVKNPNLFYNLLGQWESVDASVRGVPMLRPLIGSAKDHRIAVKNITRADFRIIPNPAVNILKIEGMVDLKKIAIFSLTGNKVLELVNPTSEINIEPLKSGMYIVYCVDSKGRSCSRKLIKNP
ncbi:MAG: hypothetical protein RLZZ161_1938 [Bacteroidota bacterium]